MNDMEKKIRMQILQEIMDDMDKRSYSKLSEKPTVVSVKEIGSNDPELLDGLKDEMGEDPVLEGKEEELGMDLDNDDEEGEDPMHAAKVLGGQDEEDDADGEG